MQEQVCWSFPLPRTHTGIMLGNSTTGLLIWGGENRLKMTVGRADLWDHRGGMPWTEKQNYRAIRRALEAGDEAGIRALFACAAEKEPGCPHRPTVLPLGRLDLRLPAGATLERGRLDLRNGEAEVTYRLDGVERVIAVRLSMRRQEFVLRLPPCDEIGVEPVPAWTYLEAYFRSVGYVPPVRLEEDALQGWIQELPVDPAVGVLCRREGALLWGVAVRAENADAVRGAGRAALAEAVARGVSGFEAENRVWWDEFWRDVPTIDVPNPRLAFLYAYGLYKFACFTAPGGVPATLQGPWIEEYALPPWSSDYHFNINVQMCYWPAYKANRAGHLMPMFDLVLGWRDHLRRVARDFIGVEDGYMLPHAVDDRCTCMGGFWTGAIDHGCTAWIAQMMYQYYLYSGDLAFLRERAFDFMKGAMRVYEAMLEKHDGVYTLPVSVSPEYRGARMDAWGADASFQLAAIHRLCEDLTAAAAALGEPVNPVWTDILAHLPKATLIGAPDEERIALWRGVDLEESHRHHSHLGGICPFDVIDFDAPALRPVVNRSLKHWVRQGMGQWSGWCMPWASMIHSRTGNGRMAELMLEIWERVFTNTGFGTLHDVEFNGVSLMGGPEPLPEPGTESRPLERMQMDAGMGALTAIQDMMLHTRRGVVRVLPGMPSTWDHAAFRGMPCEGGMKIDAVGTRGAVREITVTAERDGTLRLANPWSSSGAVLRFADGRREERSEAVIGLTLKGGGSCILTPR